MFKKIFTVCCILALLVSLSTAQGEEKKVVELEEVVVTATRTEKGLEDVPGSVSVVTKEDMEKRSVKSIDEALSTTTGIYQNSMGGGMVGHPPSISMRGISGGQRTLVMLDGLPLSNPMWGGASYYLISAEDAERIEVVKGPFSSLYGGYAMAGVVNVITKMPEKREFTLKTGYGSSWNRGESMDDLKKNFFT
jgi:iron complex outermembrane receptor protein